MLGKSALVFPSMLATLFFANAASAELYISPVFRDTVRYNQAQEPVHTNDKAPATKAVSAAPLPSKPPAPAQAAASPNPGASSAGELPPAAAGKISGESSVHGQFVMDREDVGSKPVLKYGRNVPLFVALENVVPKDWMVNPEEGLVNRVVNWEGGNSWETVLRAIAEQNGLSIVINQNERAVGISMNPDIAKHLAMRVPEVWNLKSGISLRDNLAQWSRRAGWSIDWDDSLKIDYPIVHGAVLTGPFVGQGGVVDKVLYSLRNEQKPLTAVFYSQNRVVKIKEAGYRIEQP